MTFVALKAAVVAMCVVTTAVRAQSGVRGTVTSKADQSPIAAAEVVTIDGRVRARTDERGRFRLAATRGDSVRVRALGYRELRAVAGDSMLVLEPFATMLTAVTTTAGQRTIRANESTASTMVVDRNELDAAASISVDQALRHLPGFQQIPAAPSKTTIAIRGLDAARVLVLVDGEPVPGALIDNRDIGRLSTLAADRIEVTKGPSGVEFGSDALGGVINLVTAAPSKVLAVDATMRAGELGRMESTMDISNTIGRTGFRMSGGWRQVDRVTAIDAEGSSLDRVYDVRADVRHRATDRLMLRTDLQLSQERQRWPVGGGYNGFIDNHTAQGFVEAQQLALGGVVRARVFGQFFDYQFRQAQGSAPIAGSADSLEQQERFGRAMLSYARVAGRHTIDAGAQFTSRAIVAPQKVEGDRAHDRLVEVFARDAWTHGPVLVTLGGRSTSSSLWGDAFSPSVGLAWQATPAWRMRGNVARGFRAPSFKEIRYTFANPGAGYVVEGNADLEPESSWSTDVGVAFAPAPKVLFELEGYQNRVTNLIDTRFSGTNAAGFQVYRNVNVAEARIRGLEASATVVAGAFEVRGGYNFLRARDVESGENLDRRSAHSARVSVSRTWAARSGIVTDIGAHYTGSAPVGDTTQAAFLSVNGQVRAKLTPSLELSAGVNNLFDRRPAMWTSAFGRQVFAGVRVHFRAAER